MKVLIAAGGTGGHVFPALALASELTKLAVQVVWAGRESSLEQSVARAHGFRFEALPAAGIVGKGLGARAYGVLQLGRGTMLALGLLSRIVPDAVVSAGGFASAPALAAAQVQGRPYFLLEQNRIPGRVTRLFASGSQEVFAGFPLARELRARVVVTGNPLRPELAGGERSDDGRTVLALGGSGGARALNLAVLDVAATLTNLQFIILTGRRDFDMVKSLVRTRNVELVEFTARPHELYRRATVAVSRAGGLVLSELLSYALPAILVPFPHATDGHQEANAQHLASIGAATVLDQSRLSGLTGAVQELLGDTARRNAMSAAARATARPDAAATIARRIVECSAA
jgi:UDP-N-acetylglucosamine--N-acetylmuramyl-(pentapeptide) pyrophosphoryl-undecaprenol N-acetylglucosamine transferase